MPCWIAIVPVSACSTSSHLPSLPQLTIAAFRPQIRDQAQRAYREVEAKPKDADANGRMGTLLHAFEQFESAEICYRRARILDASIFRWAYPLYLSPHVKKKPMTNLMS